ncbi:MAG: RraA family protein [Candidatus Aminicenantales bacterium]
MDFTHIKKRLARLDSASICDASQTFRVMDPGIKPLFEGIRMIGVARTAHSRGDFLTVIKALQEAVEDEVLVIDAEGDKIAMAGELFATEAKRKKLAGMVIDGGCRDVAQIRKIRFPVFARHITPMAGGASKIFKTQTQVTCGGVQVSPGDILFGDDDGVVVISQEDITHIMDGAESIQATEAKVLKKIEHQTSLFLLTNFSEHYERITKGEESKLTFTI